MNFILPKVRLMTKIDLIKYVENSIALFCPPLSKPALESTNTKTFGWVEMSESETSVTLNDTCSSSDQEKIKFQTFKRNKILWSFTRYSSQNMPILEHIHNYGGKWNMKGYPLWYFNGFFLTHFCISRFSLPSCHSREQIINRINHYAAPVLSHIYDHRRDWYECRYIPIGL